jgi:hypothetical protein
MIYRQILFSGLGTPCTKVGGLVDTHLCKEERFQWLVDDTDVCSQLFRMFNWGQNHEKLVEASVLWKLHLKELVKFSETRFANSRRQVLCRYL